MQQVRLSVESERPAYLVTSETHYPGWRAYVDGRPQPIYYTNVAFRGFPVPAGKHQILMRFEAPLFWWAAAASALGWIVWAALLATWGRRDRGCGSTEFDDHGLIPSELDHGFRPLKEKLLESSINAFAPRGEIMRQNDSSFLHARVEDSRLSLMLW